MTVDEEAMYMRIQELVQAQNGVMEEKIIRANERLIKLESALTLFSSAIQGSLANVRNANRDEVKATEKLILDELAKIRSELTLHEQRSSAYHKTIVDDIKARMK